MVVEAFTAGSQHADHAHLEGDGLPGQRMIEIEQHGIRMAVTIAVALGVLAGAAHVLRVPQFAEGVALITRRLRRRG